MPATPEAIYRLGLVAVADYALAAALYPTLRWKGVRRVAAQAAITLAIAASPCIVPQHAKGLRFYGVLWAIALMVKTYDAAAAAREGIVPSLGEYLVFLPGAQIVLRRKPAESRWSARRNLILLLWRAAGAAMAIAVCFSVFGADWSHRPFWMEHAAKVIPFYFAVINAMGAIAAGWRLLGGTAMDPFHHPAAAATPAEFWRRWNRPTAQWFHEYLYGPAGGSAHPIRATLAAFAISAVVHEYVFAIPVGHVQGFQTAFFMIQGVAAVATLRMRPRGWRRLAWIAATFAFTLATSVLFFASLNHIWRFYDHPLPGWPGRWDRWTMK